ncbi:alpha/beta-hydrolase [Microstroma glucosiphilum]|uniref:Alpha/beta-hydrolase n=1 Tax=Pseudomicrostroma glucosiphilum TaxID=1684307 RepID=A0A316U500_9BASI|nr:alpha/beta-hydrolase [Pseudomicrostroma glucosiphilum]PWN19908.1 alpha/beta-hydrolase [Pseudomicrostroma glucosiphilum]
MSSTTPAPAPSHTSTSKVKQLQLPSVFHFEGWEIRYRLSRSSGSAASKEAATDAAQAASTGAGAEPLVFVHGTPWSSAVYGPVIEALQAKDGGKGASAGTGRTSLVYDLPGYGQSQNFQSSLRALAATSAGTGETSSVRPAFVGDTSVRLQARALAALLKHTKLDGAPSDALPPLVIAHDIAGTIVLRAHLLEGCAFSRMLLVDTNTILPWGDGFYKLLRSEPGPFTRLPSPIFEAMLRAVIRSACYRGEALSADGGAGRWEDVLAQPWLPHPEDTSSQDGQHRQHSFVRQIAQANDADVAELFAADKGGGYSNVNCDVTVLWGEEDQWIPRDKVETFIGMLGERCKRKVFVPRAGHLLMLDQPEVFQREVLEWLEVE